MFICGSVARMDNPGVSLHRIRNRLAARIVRGALLLLAWAPVLPLPAAAGDKVDHERARAAVQAGEVLPLATLLERLQRTHPGQVLELELEREDGRWIYDLKLLQTDGQLLKLEVDAATGQVLELKRKDQRKVQRKTPSKTPPPVDPAR
jgi:hypothetical protein